MRHRICLRIVALALAASCGVAPAGYKVCTLPVPNDIPPAVRKQVLLLRNDDAVKRGEAAYALDQMGPRAAAAVPFLRHLLIDDAPLALVVGLGSSSSAESYCTPGTLAARALWRIRRGEITDMLRRGREPARFHVVWALVGCARDANARAVLKLALKDPSTRVRERALQGLIRVAGSGAGPLLGQALKDRSPEVRAMAVTKLAKGRGPAAVQLLTGVLGSDPHEHPRGYAAYWLGELKDPRAVGPLVKALTDPSAYVRRYAASSLSLLGDARAVEPLLRLLETPEADVQQAAVEALRRFDDPRAAAAMVRDLNSRSWVDRKHAVVALGRYPDRYANELIKAVNDRIPDVREAAIEALGWTRSRAGAATDALVRRLLGRDRRIKTRSLFLALERLGNAALSGLEKVLLAAPRTVPYGKAEDLGPEAARTLARIGTPEAVAVLRKAAASASPGARQTAEQLLARPIPPGRRHVRTAAKPGTRFKRRRSPVPPTVARKSSRPSRGAPAPAARASGGGRFRLGGIIGNVAIINGKTVSVGATVDGAKVVKIEGMQVELEVDGRRVVVRM